MDFFPEVMLSEGEGELIALGLLAVARADGQLHDRELALVQSFYGEVADERVLRNLEAESDIDPEVLAAGLTREPIPMLFLKSAILCAYADGKYHEKEKAKIEAFATALGVEAAALEELHQSVKEYLLGQLNHLKNTEAALAVAKELGI